MKKNSLTFIFFTLISYTCLSQDLTGFWKGTLSMRGCFPENNIELQIKMNGLTASGDSYHYQDIDNYVKKSFTGQYDADEKRFLVNEEIVSTYHIPFRCVICIKNFDLVYKREGNVETLSGSWGGRVLNTGADCSVGDIVLTRIRESAFKEIPEVKVDTGSIRLDFYDNAEIDGDSITIKVDGKVVLSHQRLSAKPITTYIRVDEQNTFHEVEMIAENQGSIPPNTAVLIVNAGEEYYRLNLTSTESKSARVRFVYHPSKTKKTIALK